MRVQLNQTTRDSLNEPQHSDNNTAIHECRINSHLTNHGLWQHIGETAYGSTTPGKSLLSNVNLLHDAVQSLLRDGIGGSKANVVPRNGIQHGVHVAE